MVASACKLFGGFSAVEVEALKVLKAIEMAVDIGLVLAVLETDASMVVELICSKDVLFELGLLSPLKFQRSSLITSSCGHLFCFSCIIKRIPQSDEVPAECPNSKCKVQFRSRDVTKIYGSPATVLDEDLRDRNQRLEKNNVRLRNKGDAVGPTPPPWDLTDGSWLASSLPLTVRWSTVVLYLEMESCGASSVKKLHTRIPCMSLRQE
ncbi:hypothetical protein QYF36_012497 [Acer negundo]|nr:hypothetical protein QYF36_012497 [Acer negundo]